MPQLYTSAMYGSFFSPNPGIDSASSGFGDPNHTRKSELFYASANESLSELPLQIPMGAKLHYPNPQVSAADPSFGFSFESPALPQGSPALYTPQSNSHQDNFHGQNWSPDANFVRRSPVTASQLSFSEQPSNHSTYNGTSHEFTFVEEGPGFAVDSIPESIPESISESIPEHGSHSGLGISGHIAPVQASHSFHEPPSFHNLSSEDHGSTDLDLFLREDPFSDMGKTEHWLSDVNHCDREMDEVIEAEHRKFETQPKSEPRESPIPVSPIVKPPQYTSKKSGPPTPRKLRKAKSFGSGASKYTPFTSFSLENCLNEFHIREGKILFQDETARVSKQSVTPSMSRRKSAPRLSSSLQPLKISKTSTSLSSWAGPRPSEGTMKDMESGLSSFKVHLNNSPGSDDTEFTQEYGKPDYTSSWYKELS